MSEEIITQGATSPSTWLAATPGPNGSLLTIQNGAIAYMEIPDLSALAGTQEDDHRHLDYIVAPALIVLFVWVSFLSHKVGRLKGKQ